MPERQYNKEQVAAIFDRASQVERAALPAPTEGLTLAELQEIGQEVGISPESISLAAQSLDQPAAPAAPKVFGIQIGVARTVELDRRLSESDWEALVADLRTTFHARGKLRIDGPFRQWTNGNLSALLEPTPNGHRLRLQSLKEDSRSLMLGGSVMAGIGGIFAVVYALGAHLAGPGGIPAIMGAGIIMIAWGGIRASGWARLRTAQFEDVIARLVNSSRKPGRAALPDLT